MTQVDLSTLASEPGGEPLGHEHRAVSATGASHRQRQIAFALALIAGQEGQQKFGQMREIGRKGRILLDIGGDFAVATGEGAQLWLVMGVGQEADVKDEVGLARKTKT